MVSAADLIALSNSVNKDSSPFSFFSLSVFSFCESAGLIALQAFSAILSINSCLSRSFFVNNYTKYEKCSFKVSAYFVIEVLILYFRSYT